MILQDIGIAIVAPGGCALDGGQVASGLRELEAHGAIVHNYYDHDRRFQRFGGTDDARLAALHEAARNPEVQVIMALRGAYGVSRILDRVDFGLLASSGKILTGYSDITSLHMGLLAMEGAMSYAGPMLYGDFGKPEPVAYTLESFARCLRGPTHTVEGEGAGNPVLDVSGPVWGGNLAILSHLCGTPYLPHVEGGILFIEDINEHPYRIERILIQLLNCGVLARQKALVFGAFTDYRLGPSDNGYDFEAMLAWLRERVPVPILTGLPFGHVPVRATIPVGAHARLASDGERFTLTMSGYPTLPHA
ncbi:LD-carboxypeptidase [Pseudoduganella sp. GCM10020061]|uniref:LD-carboxypeptidase n=1 Tax=Pseudoduganella sp. GCM10020061 TaxID=3317345 RepID=UPI00363B9377